jgi:hypothetical protein
MSVSVGMRRFGTTNSKGEPNRTRRTLSTLGRRYYVGNAAKDDYEAIGNEDRPFFLKAPLPVGISFWVDPWNEADGSQSGANAKHSERRRPF